VYVLPNKVAARTATAVTENSMLYRLFIVFDSSTSIYNNSPVFRADFDDLSLNYSCEFILVVQT
jgi:hypothetical protein